MSHILNISGKNDNYVCGLLDDKSLDVHINVRRIKFMKDMHKYNDQHAVLIKLYMWFGKNELRLRQRQKHITLVWRHKPHTAAAAAFSMSQTADVQPRGRMLSLRPQTELRRTNHTPPWSAV